jgi:hypothetical protein
MSTTYNTVIFLEFYRSRDVVLSGGKRSPQYRWQNFFEEPVSLFVDSRATGLYEFMPFDAQGFQYVFGGRQNQLTVGMPGLEEVYDVTEQAMQQPALIYATLYRFDGATVSWTQGNPQLMSAFIGEIETANSDFHNISWTVSSGLSKVKAQMPYRKISSTIVSRQEGQ